MLLVCRNLVFYLEKLVWPVGLTSHYPVPEPVGFDDPRVVTGVVGVVLLGVALLVSLRWTRAWAVGFAFFVLALGPTLGLVRYSWVIVSDKYVYFPVVGLLVPLAAAVAVLLDAGGKAPRARRAAVIAIGVTLLVLEVAGTRAYLTRWRDTVTLFAHMAQHARPPRAPTTTTATR